MKKKKTKQCYYSFFGQKIMIIAEHMIFTSTKMLSLWVTDICCTTTLIYYVKCVIRFLSQFFWFFFFFLKYVLTQNLIGVWSFRLLCIIQLEIGIMRHQNDKRYCNGPTKFLCFLPFVLFVAKHTLIKSTCWITTVLIHMITAKKYNFPSNQNHCGAT